MATLSQAISSFKNSPVDSMIMLSHNTSFGNFIVSDVIDSRKCSGYCISYIPTMITHALSLAKDILLTMAYSIASLVLTFTWAITCCQSKTMGMLAKKSYVLLLSSLSATGIDLLGVLFPYYAYGFSISALDTFQEMNKNIDRFYESPLPVNNYNPNVAEDNRPFIETPSKSSFDNIPRYQPKQYFEEKSTNQEHGKQVENDNSKSRKSIERPSTPSYSSLDNIPPYQMPKNYEQKKTTYQHFETADLSEEDNSNQQLNADFKNRLLKHIDETDFPFIDQELMTWLRKQFEYIEHPSQKTAFEVDLRRAMSGTEFSATKQHGIFYFTGDNYSLTIGIPLEELEKQHIDYTTFFQLFYSFILGSEKVIDASRNLCLKDLECEFGNGEKFLIIKLKEKVIDNKNLEEQLKKLLFFQLLAQGLKPQ